MKCKFDVNVHQTYTSRPYNLTCFFKKMLFPKKHLHFFLKNIVVFEEKTFFPKEYVKKIVKHTLPWIDFSMFKTNEIDG